MFKQITICVCCLVVCRIGYGQLDKCTNAQLLQAEKEAVTLRSWDALYKSYRLYGRCGDVEAAEGYSESVARILVDKWSSLPRLAQLASKDAGFRRFALGHVDATLDMHDVRTIKTNAEKRCPAALHALCADLIQQADSAIQEDADVHKKN